MNLAAREVEGNYLSTAAEVIMEETVIGLPGSHASAPAELGNSRVEQYHEFGKVLFDVMLALILLLCLLPLLFAITIFVACNGFPILYGHPRVGRNGVQFNCLKFRTMVPNSADVLQQYLRDTPDAQLEWEKHFKLRSDPRVTAIGRFLRRTSLDELPQLFNVLRGQMSLVGPRPIVPAEIDRYGSDIVYYYRCRPGITGPWQVGGRSDADYTQRVRLDVEYARYGSLRTDIGILRRTVRVVLAGSGAY